MTDITKIKLFPRPQVSQWERDPCVGYSIFQGLQINLHNNMQNII